jgi:hypothetical protein
VSTATVDLISVGALAAELGVPFPVVARLVSALCREGDPKAVVHTAVPNSRECLLFRSAADAITARLALGSAPAEPAPPVERLDCEDCGDDFPPAETVWHEPSQQRLCLDCRDAADRRADDRRDADYYLYR